MIHSTDYPSNTRMPASRHAGLLRRHIHRAGAILLTLILIGFLAGCGGSSDDTASTDSGTDNSTISALSMPSRIELTKVEDSDSGNTALSLSSISMAAADESIYNAAGTDYAELQKRSWTEDIVESLQTVNQVLEMVKDTGYDQMVNEGPYVALVTTPGGDHAAEGSGSSASSVTEALSEMTVDVVREDNDSPMYIYFWLNQEDDGPGDAVIHTLIKGRFDVTQGVSEQYPMGEMVAYVTGRELNDDGEEVDGEPSMKFALSIGSEDGQAVVECAEADLRMEEGYLMETSNELRVEATNDFTSGNAYVHEVKPDWDTRMDWDSDQPEYVDAIVQVAFDPDYIKVDNGVDDPTIYDKGDLDHQVHRYKLFDTNGDAVKINSGFPVRFKDSNAYGYVGYYGMWAPEGVTIGDNTTVVKEGTGQEYQLVQAPGKLIKHTQTRIELSKLANVEMFRGSETGGDEVIAWDGTAEQFMIVGRRGEDTNWQTEYYPVDQRQAATFDEWEMIWCESLQAGMPLDQLYGDNMPAPTNNSELAYHAQKTMIPGVDTFPTDLYMTGPGINEDNWTYDWQNPTTHHYVYDTDAMILTESGEPVIYEGDDWGREIMPLSEDQNSNGWEDTVFYSWVSGTDQWTKLTVLKNAEGEVVSFEAPLLLTYEHQLGYDYNYSQADGDTDPNDGRTFKLEYDGFELRIPWVYDELEDQWVPQLNLKDSDVSGLELTGDDGNTYVLKGWEEELKMAKIESDDPGYDAIEASLDTDTAIDAPTIQETMDDAIDALFNDGTDWSKPTDVEVKIIKGEPVTAD